MLMAGKLLRFTRVLSAPAVLLGLWLWLGYGIGQGSGWMHAKLVVVALALAYQHVCGRIYKQFIAHQNAKGQVWFRWFNEAPVLMLVAAVILVVVKPF